MIISEFCDKQAMTTKDIIKDFNSWIKTQDGTKLAIEQRQEIEKLCEKNPILNILCSAMQEIGYESF